MGTMKIAQRIQIGLVFFAMILGFVTELKAFGEVGIVQLDSLPLNKKSNRATQSLRLSKRIVIKERLPWYPSGQSVHNEVLKDSLGLFPFSCGEKKWPISSRGFVTGGYMISNESNGFHLRFDNPYKLKSVVFPRKNNLQKVRSRSMGLEFGYYSHPSLHRNLYLMANKEWKYQSKKHWNYGLTAGMGYSRTLLNNPTYRLKDNEFQKVPFAGYNYVALQLGARVGYRIKRGASVYLGYDVLALTPYNRFLIPRKQLQLGLSVPANWFVDGFKLRPR
jgi:hypothetical protein